MTANVKVEIAKRTERAARAERRAAFPPDAEVFAALNQTLPPEAAVAAGRARHCGRAGGPAQPGTGPRRPSARRAAGSSARRASAAAAAAAVAAQEAVPAEAAGGGERDPARMMERFKRMSPEEQQQFIARMKERGRDTSAFERRRTRAAEAGAARKRRRKPRRARRAGGKTIDALFAPLPTIETPRPRLAVHEPPAEAGATCASASPTAPTRSC